MTLRDWWEGLKIRLSRKHEPFIKTNAGEFGGGRDVNYLREEVERRLCCVTGCERFAYSTWQGCADDRIHRPFCAEHDVELNRMVQEWVGDPDCERKIVAYANQVQEDLSRSLEIDWLIR